MQGRKEGGEEIQFKCGKGLNYLVGQDTFQIGNQSHSIRNFGAQFERDSSCELFVGIVHLTPSLTAEKSLKIVISY